MKVMVGVEIGDRTVTETIITTEDFRGDYRNAVGECMARIELATYGPQQAEGHAFDEPLKMRNKP